MKQATMTEPGRIIFEDVPVPVPGPREILLGIKRIGVCGSDIHVYHGKHPFTSYPVIQGHEFSARVESIGTGVTRVSPGMKATARPQVVCGRCKPCRRGDYNICDVLKVEGFQAPGCAREFFITTEDKIVPLPDSLTYDQGAFVEPVSVAVHAVARGGNLAGKNIVVLGAGTIGNLVAQVAHCCGARDIFITDVSEYRLEIARRCGIQHVSNASKETLKDAAQRVFGEDGFDIAFEAVGIETTMAAAIDAINKGGTIVVIGVFQEKPRIDLALVGDRELSLIGTLMYKHEDYIHAVDRIAAGDIITEPLLTNHFPFEQYADAYAFIEQQGDKALKVMIDVP
jgi:2-desacetyl-2-hydroxyethyl bacteriochlorophyllide A dehydrogenase